MEHQFEDRIFKSRTRVGTIPMVSSPPSDPAVSQAFTGFAYLRKLASQRRRIQRGLAESPPKLKRDPERSSTNGDYRGQLPGNKPWWSIKMVNCAGCQRTLLGESEEALRAMSAPGRIGCKGKMNKARKCFRFLPPPVAVRVDGRPYCSCCKGV